MQQYICLKIKKYQFNIITEPKKDYKFNDLVKLFTANNNHYIMTYNDNDSWYSEPYMTVPYDLYVLLKKIKNFLYEYADDYYDHYVTQM